MNLLQQANEYLRMKSYDEAIRVYVEAIQTYQPLTHVILPSLERAQACREMARSSVNLPRVLICGWDLSGNAVGRVHTLAEIYKEIADVGVIGCFFSNRGDIFWTPMKRVCSIIDSIQVQDQRNFIPQAIKLVLNNPCDILHLSKPRFPNILIGILYKLLWNSRVFMDIDDEELAFVSAAEALRPNEYLTIHSCLPKLDDLTGKGWTQIGVALARIFDGVTVVNPPLQQRYGGVIVRHARDESVFKPSLERRQSSRAMLGITPEQKIILFLGTPRAHKGLLETAKAIAHLKRDDVLFLIVGDFPMPLQWLKAEIEGLPNLNKRFLANQPFENIPDILAVGDLCVLLQDPDNLAAQFQTPAKLSDALAMGLTVLAEPTPALADLAEKGAFQPISRSNLSEALGAALNQISVVHGVPTAHPVFNEYLSIVSNRPVVESLMNAHKCNPRQFFHNNPSLKIVAEIANLEFLLPVH